jgi:hypothetical protein
MLCKVTTTNCMQTLHSSSKIGKRLCRGGTSGETSSADGKTDRIRYIH